jgi:hypothetical protein
MNISKTLSILRPYGTLCERVVTYYFYQYLIPNGIVP